MGVPVLVILDIHVYLSVICLALLYYLFGSSKPRKPTQARTEHNHLPPVLVKERPTQKLNIDLPLDGFLKKRNSLGIWKKCYFVVDDLYVRYRKSKFQLAETDLKPLIDVESLGTVTSKGKILTIKSEKKKYTLKAGDEAEAIRWCKALQEKQSKAHENSCASFLLATDTKEKQEWASAYIRSEANLFNKWTTPNPHIQDSIELINQFRKQVKPILAKYPSDAYCVEVPLVDDTCIRFLDARGSNVDKAVEMFENAVQYRADNQIDIVMDKPFEAGEKIFADYPHGWHKTDKFGRPVYIERIGQLDIPKLMEITTMDELVTYHIHNSEYLRRKVIPSCSQQKDANIYQIMTILDLNGLGKRHLRKECYEFINKISKIDQDVFPETLAKCFIINAPFIFSAAWMIIKPWLDVKVQKKIDIRYGPATEQLLQYIDANDLPTFLGGKCKCEGGCFHGSEFGKDYIQLMRLGEAEWTKTKVAVNA